MGFDHNWWVVIVLFLELCFYSTNSQHLTCHPRDLDALRDYANELEVKPNGWDFNTSRGYCCEWVGITCESSSSLHLNDPNNTARITKLELVHKGLYGNLSESLGLLDQLRVLNLSDNFITSSIPPSIFNLVNLETLDLSSNGLVGEIPQSLNLPSLTNLRLSSNNLNGSLPIHVCQNSTKLKLIRLQWNKFAGDFPYGFEKCTLLGQLFLGWNHLTGNIPKDLYHLQSLSLLDIRQNDLSGSLSPALGNLSHLVRLDVSYNRFSGEIPDVFDNILELQYFVAHSNTFTGGIPKSLGNVQALILLNLRNNALSGPLLLNCAVMTNLTSLDLESNRFNGSLPENLPFCRNLRNVNLAENPSSSRLVNISSALRILQHCRNLTTLVLSLNFDNEMLHDDPNLHFKKLQMLAITNSKLTGAMPSWLSKSTNLELLDLSSNRLSGPIPDWIGGFTDLFYLDLSRNSFTGEIPKSLTMLQRLSSRDISFEEPFLFTRNEFGRQISDSRATLDLSENHLSGHIWEEFGNLKKLNVFDLNSNRISGSIPSTLSRMTRLEVLDLSNNRISGSIPGSLQLLTFLSSFNVSNNNLSGRIPPGGIFQTFPNSSFEGNNFCGDNLPRQCQVDIVDNKPSRTSDSDDFVLDFSYGVALGYGLSFVIVAFFTCYVFELPRK